MAQKLIVHLDTKPIYDIIVEDSFDRLEEEACQQIPTSGKVCIVTDSNVAPLYQTQVEQQLVRCCSQIDVFIFPAGEAYKNLDTVRQLYEYLINRHYDRGDILVALGGGVVGDLCGYTAATYLRGVNFIQIPTTLLSQVDSSIGGKTGVDFDSYKNMVGAFHMPCLVYSNTATLKTLSEEQFASGMGEIIKHGLIKDKRYYQWILEHAELISARNLNVCEEMILRSDQIKRDVVEQDPKEQGDRALLNFGHTLGHAIEKLMDFQLLHGQCVALGSLGAAYLSFKRGMITEDELKQIQETFRQFSLPVDLTNFGLNLDTVIQTTKSDKKMDSGMIKFILLRTTGDAYVDRSVTDAEMMTALLWLTGGHNEE